MIPDDRGIFVLCYNSCLRGMGDADTLVYRLSCLCSARAPASAHKLLFTSIIEEDTHMDAPTTSLIQDIESRCRDFEAAFSRSDPRELAQLYTRNGQLLPPATGLVEGRDLIAAFWGDLMAAGMTSARLESTETESCGDTVIEMGRYTIGSAGEQVVDQGKYVVIWKQEDGVWKMHRDIWNSSLPPQQ